MTPIRHFVTGRVIGVSIDGVDYPASTDETRISRTLNFDLRQPPPEVAHAALRMLADEVQGERTTRHIGNVIRIDVVAADGARHVFSATVTY